MKSFRRIAYVAAAVVAIGLSTGCDPQGIKSTPIAGSPSSKSVHDDSSPPARVRTVRPSREHLKRITTQPAHVEPFEKIDVYANLAGYVARLGQVKGPDGKERDIDIGDRVAKDQVLLVLSVPELRENVSAKKAAAEKAVAMVSAATARLEQAKANLDQWEAEVRFRKSEADRYKRLVAERTATPEQVEEKKYQHLAAVASLSAAKASVATARADERVAEAQRVEAAATYAQAVAQYGYSEIRAEIPGVITRRSVDRGAFVRSAATGQTQPLFTLARVDRVRVVTDVPETDSAMVKIGQSAAIRIDALRGQSIAGKVMRLSDALDPSTRTMRVEVEPNELPAGLRTGQFGSVAITLADYANALLLPTSVLVVGEKPAVMVVVDGRAQRRDIVLGINDGNRMQVVSGLNADEEVIAEGKDTVRDGQRVEVVR